MGRLFFVCQGGGRRVETSGVERLFRCRPIARSVCTTLLLVRWSGSGMKGAWSVAADTAIIGEGSLSQVNQTPASTFCTGTVTEIRQHVLQLQCQGPQYSLTQCRQPAAGSLHFAKMIEKGEGGGER